MLQTRKYITVFVAWLVYLFRMNTTNDLQVGRDIQWRVMEQVIAYLDPSRRSSMRLLSKDFDGFIMGVLRNIMVLL